jgi:hypothetical protein
MTGLGEKMLSNRSNEKEIKNTDYPIGIGLGVGLGITFGAVFGVVFGNVGVGVALGICFGAALGSVLKWWKEFQEKHDSLDRE